MRSVTETDGVLLVDKAPRMTSHDVVAIARRALGTKKVGHCGTLDPLATGLLLITIGRGTKIQDLLMSEDKEYVGALRLGEVTNRRRTIASSASSCGTAGFGGITESERKLRLPAPRSTSSHPDAEAPATRPPRLGGSDSSPRRGRRRAPLSSRTSS